MSIKILNKWVQTWLKQKFSSFSLTSLYTIFRDLKFLWIIIGTLTLLGGPSVACDQQSAGASSEDIKRGEKTDKWHWNLETTRSILCNNSILEKSPQLEPKIVTGISWSEVNHATTESSGGLVSVFATIYLVFINDALKYNEITVFCNSHCQ
jgi:hypothetical protein